MITNGERSGVLDIDRVCSYQKDNIKTKIFYQQYLLK